MSVDKKLFLKADMDDQFPFPNPMLRHLDKLVGTWQVKGRETGHHGEIDGLVTFEWLDGGFFMRQQVKVNHMGNLISGIEIIGYERKWDTEEPVTDCTSHFFDNFGNHFEYVWEVHNQTLIIWSGYAGSPAHYKGRFSDDNNVLTGAWKWPGGGYQSTLTRIKAQGTGAPDNYM